MTKKVSFRARPPTTAPGALSPVPSQAAIDAWVNDELLAGSEPMKRFTFEVPLSLHKRIKVRCASQDRQMAEVLRELLETHFPPEPGLTNGHSETQMR